jgi:chromosome segregation ATPase
MSDLELTMMRRVGELKAEVERLKKFNEEALAHIAKEERKSRERLEMEQAENARLKADVNELSDGLKLASEVGIKMADEVTRLKAEVERLKNNCDYLDAKLDEELDKSAMLCGQVERLTKAGDSLAYRYALALSASYGDGTEEDAMDNLNNPDREELVNWKSAKEGKGQP